ncbi:sensor histidine kinase [Parapedobacter sp. 10938]|uniref:sensor histidine kinase n=1 Tax=Parapedobacter flavus TaxID=3110225 RepID=UPI002DB9C58C|nr:histidine kinase [Parapedobacter sp. 10938]MEC3879745.1 histidine kinase [Parapedobacter sp. 10938]
MQLSLQKKLSFPFFDRYKLEVYQALYWVGYFLLTLVKNTGLDVSYPWWLVFLADVLVIGIIYTIVFIFARTYLKPIRGTFVIAFTFLLYSLVYYILIYTLLPKLGYITYDEDAKFTWPIFLFSMFLFFHHAMVEAGLLAAIYRIRKDERRKRKLLEEKHRMELQWLMGQMEPHEQTNMLDIPYAMALKRDGEIANTLRELKTYWRYIQEKARDADSAVPFAEEMAHCNRIVAINQRRFDETHITMDIPAEHCGWQVPALSISALLKNAFKYGVSWEEHAPISLVATCSEHRLEVTIRNKTNAHKAAEQSSGIGNENIRRRLRLLYGDQAWLETRDTDSGWYEAVLTVNRSYKP